MSSTHTYTVSDATFARTWHVFLEFFKLLFIRRCRDAVRGNIRENNRARALCVINTVDAAVSRNTIARVRTPRYFNFASRRCPQSRPALQVWLRPRMHRQRNRHPCYRTDVQGYAGSCPPYKPLHRGDTSGNLESSDSPLMSIFRQHSTTVRTAVFSVIRRTTSRERASHLSVRFLRPFYAILWFRAIFSSATRARGSHSALADAMATDDSSA